MHIFFAFFEYLWYNVGINLKGCRFMIMRNEKPKKKAYELNDDELDEYFDEDMDDDLKNVVEIEDENSVDEDSEEYEKYEDVDDYSFNWIGILDIVSTWFIRIGIALAIVLLIIFVVTLKFKTLLLFLLGLVIAFGFGYFFMYCLDIVLDK